MNSASTQFAPGRRAVIREYGETPLDAVDHHLVFEDQMPPGPSTLKAHECLLAVQSTAVGWVDLIMSSGQYQHMAPPPYTPGLEFTAEVLWSGAKAQQAGRNPGDAVIADGFKTGPRSHGDGGRFACR